MDHPSSKTKDNPQFQSAPDFGNVGISGNVPLDALDFMNFIDNYNTPEETTMSGMVHQL